MKNRMQIKRSTLLKVVGGLAVGVMSVGMLMLASPSSQAGAPAAAVAKEAAKQRLSETIQERFEVQRLVAGMYKASPPQTETIRERLEVQRVQAGMARNTTPYSESILERFEVQRVVAGPLEMEEPLTDIEDEGGIDRMFEAYELSEENTEIIVAASGAVAGFHGLSEENTEIVFPASVSVAGFHGMSEVNMVDIEDEGGTGRLFEGWEYPVVYPELEG